ncbi:MAG: hypothetical protein FJX74_25150 [Armatimonadetes bacterium]|nr:hypothetical protein [Armatimonadota bacterium]
MLSLTLLAVLGAASPQGEAVDGQPPILVTFDAHADPMQAFPAPIRERIYVQWRDALNWLLDETEPRGAKVSFSSVGEFIEYCVQDDPAGLDLLRRLYASGGTLGTHTHDEMHFGRHDWRPVGFQASLELSERVWQDSIEMLDYAVTRALGITDPAEVRKVNCLRGSHVPADGAAFRELMARYGMTIHQAGPGEDMAGLFHHYLFHPYRESFDNPLAEDRTSPVILTQAGPVLGAKAVHKGVEQDMSLPRVQSLFLQEVLNWLHAATTGTGEQVWCFGWAVHAADIAPGRGVSRPWVRPTLDWFDEHFIGKPIGGQVVAQYGSYADEARAYLDWEQAHPDAPVPGYPLRERDWDRYPFLLPPTVYLWDARWEKAVRSDDRGQVHLLAAGEGIGGPYPLVVALPAGVEALEADLSPVDPGEWMRIDPASGDATRVAAECEVSGSGAILVPAEHYRSTAELMARIDAKFPKQLPGPAGGARRRDFLRDFDRNNDGVVTPQEFTGPPAVFRRLDTNTDGRIDGNEAARDAPPR